MSDTLETIYKFIRRGFSARIPLSEKDISVIREIVETGNGTLQIARRLNISDKAVHNRKYMIMRKFGFNSTHSVNLIYCYTLIRFRFGLMESSVGYDTGSGQPDLQISENQLTAF